jgi:RHS repeat-associated protein
MPGTSINNFTTISRFDFDRLRRPTGVSKKIGSQDYKKLVSYTHDELGNIKTKKLSPDYNAGAGIETLKYDYNIQGWLNGINKDFALSASSLNQWDHFFGMYMGYDNRDTRFTAAQYNGNITGSIWKTQGDNMPRKYDYEYDNANRFTKALFVQKEKPSEVNWANNKMDFSVTDISYDENGNLKTMFQKGVIPGNNSPVFIDKLTYEYKSVADNQWSNQLKKVFDQPDLTASNNGSLGDFKDETFGTNGDDYVYDYNGNLTKDNNKKIRINSNSGVQYNYFDKPQKITIESKSITEFTYDADGAKLAKKVTNTVTGISKTTWYMGAFIYEEEGSQLNLQMILHEEGRIRVYSPVNNPRLTIAGNFDLPDSKKGTYDFFIKDNLQNIRTIVTEETHSEFNNCGMEDANDYYESRMFGQVDANGNPVTGVNEVSSTRVNKSEAPGWNTNGTLQISKLGYFGKKLGPNMMLKVMAGDNVAARTDYYYTGTVDNSGPNNFLPTILNSLISSLSYSATTSNVHGTATNITSNINSNPGEFGSFLNSQNTGTITTPQAYMNILFFDENFNFVPYDNVTGLGSYAWRVTNSGDGQKILPQISKAPKNGYAFVYLSNESKTFVYFDNFEVTHVRGRLIEENSYYAYGLKIAALSSKVFDASPNPYQYQGDYNDFEDETAWNDFELRSYDGQIGRFLQNDPYDQFASSYTGMGNDPVNNVDPTGGFSLGGLISGITGSSNVLFNTAALAVGGALVGGIVDFATGGDGRGALIGAGIGVGVGLASGINWGGIGASTIASAGVSMANVALNVTTQNMSNNVSYASYLSNEHSNYDVASIGFAGSDPPGFFSRLWRSYQRLDRWVGEHGGDWINENINPVTPFAELVTGKQFTQGNFTTDKPRLQSATEAVIVLIPGGKLVGTGEKLFIKGVGNISKDYFHKTIKKKILNAAGKFGHIVGDNPDIVVEGEKIVLKGVYQSFKGKTFETTLKAVDFFK